MLSTSEARDILLAAARAVSQTEIVPTHEAVGRILAEAIVSSIDVPPMDVSAMDGYAVCLADLQPAAVPPAPSAQVRVFSVTQRIPAGAVPSTLIAASAARIFTGAPLPPGADTVVMQEEAIESPPSDGGPWPTVQFSPDFRATEGQWINRRGGDIRAGSVVLDVGTRLTPQALGLAASVGVAAVTVVRRLRVALLFTGNELKRPGEPLVPGAIYNSNRYTLGGLLAQMGCDVTDYGIVADTLDATRAALRAAAAAHDVVLSSGGVSVGEEDHVKPAVQAEGSLTMWKIAMKPGKPLAFGTLRRAVSTDMADDAYFIGLPGNPVSTFVTFLLFVRPFLLRLQGIDDVMPHAIAVRADFAYKGDRRNEFLRARLNARGGVEAYPTQSSAVLTSTVWADGLIDNPPGQDIAVGDTVQFLPMAALIH